PNGAGSPDATHLGACGFTYGLGSTWRSGIVKNCPSNAYLESDHIFLNSTITSSYIARVISGSVIPNPPISVVDEPRPVPNSKRPPEMWSIIATRSATRAGWLTGGVTLMMPLPTWMLFVRASTHGINTSFAEMCE